MAKNLRSKKILNRLTDPVLFHLGDRKQEYFWCGLRNTAEWAEATYYPGQKKRTMLLMHKIRIFWYRGIKVLDSSAEPRVNATCYCRDFTHRCIAAKSDCRFFDIAWCITRMVLFFGQGSSIGVVCKLSTALAHTALQFVLSCWFDLWFVVRNPAMHLSLLVFTK